MGGTNGLFLLPLEGESWPPGEHSFDSRPLFPGVLPDWVNNHVAQAVIGAILVIVFWLWMSRNLKVVPTKKQFIGEQLYGHDQIAAFRSGRDPKSVVGRDLLKLWVVTYGRDFGTANCEFRRHGSARLGRQSHTWMRTPDGWRIVAAHVSFQGEATPMKA